MKKRILWLAVVWAAALAAGEKLPVVLDARPGAGVTAPVVYWTESRKEPRALQIYCVRVDLSAAEVEAAALIPADPDGPGPAEAALEKPVELAARPGVLAAVNANAFDVVPPPPGEKKARSGYYAGAPATMRGWGKDETREASPVQDGFANFWTDAAGLGHIGVPAAGTQARMAVAGFRALLRDGKSVSEETKPLHPRTAVGLSADGKTMWMVVVDGRQPGYSEGMALGELAGLMLELGCANALNLDGGGSAIMLVAKTGEKPEVVSRPSDKATRPVPVMLAVRKKQ
ncbi:MAG TPA: phosphodiester glycosidase family protein [Planctomycetota bacterium]|jgi:hypothetical protein